MRQPVLLLGRSTCVIREPGEGSVLTTEEKTRRFPLVETPLLFAFPPAGRMNFKNMREYLAWLYYQYLLITGIYVLESWEKSIFNSVLFSAIAMVVYTSYVFVPIHVHLALEFFFENFGGQPESTMALMN
ncbi:hypothetical protein XENOCAPTIV_018711 [Xenoophorus captivus]|uniref:Serine palmitoyltransferase small subunit B n=1 Tax=Xenoophorus captivus TaxID=1517983 RepID=A0ABV0QMA2_9TELE